VWKLADFGFSSDAHSKSFVSSASSKGTSGYRAPELLEDSGYYNAKVDIWALGCILYELATNKKAFPNDYAVFQAKVSGSIPDIDLDNAFDDNDKASIRNSIYSMLQIMPNSRPSSVQLANDFARNLEGLQIASPPDVRIDQHFQMKPRTVDREADALYDRFINQVSDDVPKAMLPSESIAVSRLSPDTNTRPTPTVELTDFSA